MQGLCKLDQRLAPTMVAQLVLGLQEPLKRLESQPVLLELLLKLVPEPDYYCIRELVVAQELHPQEKVQALHKT